MFIKYNKIKLLIKLILFSFICQSSVYSYNNIDDFKKTLPEKCLNKEPSFEDALYCIKKYFTFRGFPVNPKIIKDLMGDVYPSGIVAINILDAQKSDKYYVDSKNLSISGSSDQPFPHLSIDLSSEFGSIVHTSFLTYYVYEITDNEVYLLQIDHCFGGSEIFQGLLFVRIVEDSNLLNEKMLLIENLGFIGIGSRFALPTITVNGNKVHVIIESLNSSKEEMLIDTSILNK
jgi:hypothetical protein